MEGVKDTENEGRGEKKKWKLLQYFPHRLSTIQNNLCFEEYHHKLACQNNRNWLDFPGIEGTSFNLLYISKHLRFCYGLNIPLLQHISIFINYT